MPSGSKRNTEENHANETKEVGALAPTYRHRIYWASAPEESSRPQWHSHSWLCSYDHDRCSRQIGDGPTVLTNVPVAQACPEVGSVRLLDLRLFVRPIAFAATRINRSLANVAVAERLGRPCSVSWSLCRA